MIGIAVGACICGYVPENMLAGILGAEAWWSVPLAEIALSLPEMIILRRVRKPRLIGAFVIIVAGGMIFTGYLFYFVLANW